MNSFVLGEVESLLVQQPLLAKNEANNGLKISGKYKICYQFEDEVFEDYFSIEIFIPDGFPEDIPTIISADGTIRANNYNGHIYENGQFCLEHDTVIATYLLDNPSFLGFLTRYLESYLFGFLYYRKYKILPFGEHKHGIPGLMDHYCDLFNTSDIRIAYILLTCLIKDNLQGHILCPCQSGKRYRNCHRERINALRSNRLYERYKNDYARIMVEVNKTR